MKSILIIIISASLVTVSPAQNVELSSPQKEAFQELIENYTKGREEKDANLLKSILTADIDQLVSSGEWRNGKTEALSGMLQSSSKNPGKRSISIDKMRTLTTDCAILDAKYSIENADGSFRRMWSTFVVVKDANVWKISAIRNMLPTQQE